MPKVMCAAIECEFNNGNKCTVKKINLSHGNINTVHEGRKDVWTCQMFQMSDEAKEILGMIRARFDGLKETQ